MESGEVLAQPNFFSPCPFSPFLPGRGRGPAGGRGRGEGRGTSGENRLTRPGRLPAAHSRHPRRGLAGAISRLAGALRLSFPFLITSVPEKNWHLLHSGRLLSASQVADSVRGPVYLHSTSNAMTMIIISCYYNFLPPLPYRQEASTAVSETHICPSLTSKLSTSHPTLGTLLLLIPNRVNGLL